MEKKKASTPAIFSGDGYRLTVKDLDPVGESIPYGTDVKGVYYDGYPQIVKQEGSKPVYEVKVEKDIMVPMRDGVRLAVDVYRPDVKGKEKFPVILSYGPHGKDAQEAAQWMPKQAYNPDTPFWDGYLEAGNINYVVKRGYVHVIPEPRGKGNSEGISLSYMGEAPEDIYDIIDWIATQSWCNGNVGMMGACDYAGKQILTAALAPHPNLKAINPFENVAGRGDYFHGIYDCLFFNILAGRHGNDSGVAPDNDPLPAHMLSLPKEELEARLQEALNHPDIKYNTKFYSLLRYPKRDPLSFDSLLLYLFPDLLPDEASGNPMSSLPVHKVNIPTYLSCTWSWRLYVWTTLESWESISTPKEKKKLMLMPPGSPDRPFVQYADETVRWHDYWLKGIDTGILDEPPIKMFVMGINKWRFEDEWPLARTRWTKFYLHPKGGLSTEPPRAGGPDTFTQPAPYQDPTVYCLRYSTGPLGEDTEITGPLALYLEASIDKEDTNWMADLVDVDPEGNRQLISQGYLKAAHRALDKSKSKPYQPIHPRRDPVPVPPGELIEYAIAMMPTANLFQKGHSMELIIRNQDDLLSTQGIWGVYLMPFMQTVTHNIHLGNSHLLLPVIPANRK